MAYDLVKQTHPGAPCAVGLWVIQCGTGRQGRIAQPIAGCRGVRVKFPGQVLIEDCDPSALSYAGPPPRPADPWCAT